MGKGTFFSPEEECVRKSKPHGRANTYFSLPDGDPRPQGEGPSCGVPPHTNEVCPRIGGDRWNCRLEPLGNLPGSWRRFIGPNPTSGRSPFSAQLAPPLLLAFVAFTMLCPSKCSPLRTSSFSGLPYLIPAFLSVHPPYLPAVFWMVTAPSVSILSDPVKFPAYSQVCQKEVRCELMRRKGRCC